MIITQDKPFSPEQINQLKEEFVTYIKTVIEIETKVVDFNSFINIRPRDNNPTNDIQSEQLRQQYKELTKFFFQEIYAQ